MNIYTTAVEHGQKVEAELSRNIADDQERERTSAVDPQRTTTAQ
jgi:hypothetical protein